MSTRLFLALPLLLSALVAGGCAADADPQAQDDQEDAPVGVESELVTATLAKGYSGPHLDLSLTKTGGSLQFECGWGSLSAPLRLDASGRFSVAGTFTQGTGIRPPGAPAPVAEPVQYKGQLTGSKIAIRFTPSGASTQRFTLTANAGSQLMRCM